MAKQKFREFDIIPIYAPVSGLAGHVPSTMLKPQFCADCLNVRFKNGEVRKRTGYVAYGTGTITGVPLGFFRYQKWDGTEYTILATTTNVYYLNAGAWDSIANSLNGSVDSRCRFMNIQDKLLFTNKVDGIAEWDGITWQAIAGASDYKTGLILPHSFRVVAFDMVESGNPVPIRMRWSDIGDYSSWSSNSFIDLTEGAGARIVGAEPIYDYIAVYKDYSILMINYIGGTSIFSPNVHIHNMGLAARDAIVNLHTHHVFLGWDNVYAWNAGWQLQEIGNAIKEELFSELNDDNIGRCFMIHNSKEKEIHLFTPIATDSYPTRFWTYKYEISQEEGIRGVWSKNVLASTSCGNSVTIGGTERSLLGLSNGTIVHYDYTSLNDIAEAIASYFETPDFVISEEEYILEKETFQGLSVEAQGHKLTLNYSKNLGTTYTSLPEKTLQSTTNYNQEDWFFKDQGSQMRFKFTNNNAGETYKFRFYALKLIPKEALK